MFIFWLTSATYPQIFSSEIGVFWLKSTLFCHKNKYETFKAAIEICIAVSCFPNGINLAKKQIHRFIVGYFRHRSCESTAISHSIFTQSTFTLHM